MLWVDRSRSVSMSNKRYQRSGPVNRLRFAHRTNRSRSARLPNKQNIRQNSKANTQTAEKNRCICLKRCCIL